MFGRRPSGAAGGPTLADELGRLERRSEERLAGRNPPYSRALLAAETGISTKSLNSWLDGARRPREFGSLLKVVTALSTWADELPVDEKHWRRLYATVRPTGKPAPKRRRRVLWGAAGTLALGAVGTLIGTIVTGAASPIGPAIDKNIGLGASSASPSPSAAETLQASASWCCKLTTVVASIGYYWAGSESSLNALLKSGNGMDALMPGGVGIVEIPLQTAGDESIYVGPPEIQVLSRKANVGNGIIGIIPLGGQGSAPPNQFMADIDAAQPSTVPYAVGSGGQAGLSTAPAYYYVSAGSPEILLLEVRDTGCDCTFDVKLNWQAQGRSYSRVLEDGNQPFHMVGSSGLAWYSGDPVFGVNLKSVGGSSFPAG